MTPKDVVIQLVCAALVGAVSFFVVGAGMGWPAAEVAGPVGLILFGLALPVTLVVALPQAQALKVGPWLLVGAAVFTVMALLGLNEGAGALRMAAGFAMLQFICWQIAHITCVGLLDLD